MSGQTNRQPNEHYMKFVNGVAAKILCPSTKFVVKPKTPKSATLK